ncbi:MAG: hypothetical protein JO332_03535 [Planctomycetaceae bacterium]|nr:hypothetical protein [Planctomycetaceae bacterium]
MRFLVSVVALTLLSGLLGCDVAVVALLASKSGSKSKNSGRAAPDVTFRLWAAELGGITGASEQATILANHGDPDPARWTQLDATTTSGEYAMPTPTAGGFNAVLVQATVNQVYEIDAFEVLDGSGTTTSTPSTVFGGNVDAVAGLSRAQGPPDGVGTLTAATDTDRSFVMMKSGSAITKFRINLWQKNAARVSGDVEWVNTLVRVNDQKAGGAALNSAGVTHLTFRDPGAIYLARISSSGNIVQDSNTDDVTSIEGTVSTPVGTASIAINTNPGPDLDDIFVAATRQAGDIRLQKFVGISASNSWQVPALSGSGVDRVEANGLALNSAGELFLAAGLDAGGLGGGVNHFLKKYSKVNGADMWASASPSSPPAHGDTANTYWYAVATDGTQDVFTTGDLTSVILLGTPDVFTTRLLDTNTATFNGGVTETWASHDMGGGTTPARGVTIGVDGNHSVYVGGFTTGTSDLDGFIIKYQGGGSSAGVHFAPKRAGKDEILDIAVEADGTVYATGYETNGGQEDLVLYKLKPNGAVDWKRTLDFGGLADRGVQVMTTATHVIVVGQVGNNQTANDLDIHVRKYVK